MKKLKDISVRELLSIEDGFYKLETPVAYATVTGKGESTTGEISGVINISTDTKILDGVTKVVTALADDTSYYVDNIWQDGDVLEVSAMDETSGGDEGGGSGGLKTAKVTLVNGTTGCLHGAIIEKDSYGDSITNYTNKYSADEVSVVLGENGIAFFDFDVPTGKHGRIEGEIAWEEEDGCYHVFGDCTITFS